jgi:hypothetical protein
LQILLSGHTTVFLRVADGRLQTLILNLSQADAAGFQAQTAGNNLLEQLWLKWLSGTGVYPHCF